MYDKEKVYDEEIYPLIDKIINVCKEHGIPFFSTFFIRDTEAGAGNDLWVTTNVHQNQDYIPPAFFEYVKLKQRMEREGSSFVAMTVTKVVK